jgi:hypothetical protein
MGSIASKNTEQWQYEIGEQLAPRNLESAGMIESLSNVSGTKSNLQGFQYFSSLPVLLYL